LIVVDAINAGEMSFDRIANRFVNETRLLCVLCLDEAVKGCGPLAGRIAPSSGDAIGADGGAVSFKGSPEMRRADG
jgi:hypothetical protein